MIRLAKVKEIDLILQITKACAAKMVEEGIYQWNEHYPTKQAFENDLKRKELYVLLHENNVIGCITLSRYKDSEYEEVSWLSEDSKNLYVHRLAIHPSYQHQGRAKQLMDFAESFAINNHFDSIRLDTFSKNKRNQKFYESRGYQRLDNIYFPKQSDAPFYCYELLLTP